MDSDDSEDLSQISLPDVKQNICELEDD